MAANGSARIKGSGESGSGSFAQTVIAQGADEAEMCGTVSPSEMTMEEYKQCISQQIRRMPVHPSRRQENISVIISEEGYAAMKRDPEYEAWVLDNLKAIYSRPGSYCGSTDKIYTNIYIVESA